MSVKIIQPNPGPQEKFLSSPADIAIYGGAAGGGKSFALLLECLRYVHVPDFKAVVLRKTLTQVKNIGGLWDSSQQIFSRVGATPRESDLSWTFPSGACVQFASMNHENDKYNWDGTEIPLICFDELIHFSQSQFFYMMSRNRTTCGVPSRIRATTNPDAASWVKDFIQWWIDQETGYPIPERSGLLRWYYIFDGMFNWYDSKTQAMIANPELASEAEPKSVTFIASKLDDNLVLQQKDPGYKANLLALSPMQRERLLRGNWNYVNEGGSMFNQDWWNFVDYPPDDLKLTVRYWDKAATPNGGCETAGVKMSKTKAGVYFVEDVVHGQWSTCEREKIIRQTAELDGKEVQILIEKEPGSAGKDSAKYTIINLAGFNVRSDSPTGSKTERASPFSSQVEAGNVYLLKAGWNKDYINQHHNFPKTKLKDMVDASSGAFNWLVDKQRLPKWQSVFGEPKLFDPEEVNRYVEW